MDSKENYLNIIQGYATDIDKERNNLITRMSRYVVPKYDYEEPTNILSKRKLEKQKKETE